MQKLAKMDAQKTDISTVTAQTKLLERRGSTMAIVCKPRSGSCLQYSDWLLQCHDPLRTLTICNSWQQNSKMQNVGPN